MIRDNIWFFFIACFLGSIFFKPLSAQQVQLPLNPDIQYQIETEISPEENFHSSIRPYYKQDLPSLGLLGSNKPFFLKRWAEKKIGSLNVYPVIQAQTTAGPGLQSFFNNYYYGIGGNFSIGQKLAAGVNYFTGEFANLPWIDSIAKKQRVIPGIGKVKGTHMGYSIQYLDFYVNIRTSEYFCLEAGKGKTFIGDGYRSLLLSDYTLPYPYFKIITRAWKFQYLNLWSINRHYHFIQDKSLYSLMALHYLSFKPNAYITLAFFESQVYANRDTGGTSIRAEGAYFNPVIFYRPLEYSMGSADNALMGFNIKIQINPRHQLYGQIAIDEFNWLILRTQRGWWGNKQAFQLGYKWYNIFSLKGLGIQLEGNYIRPYMYSHALVLQNYSHYNLPLAHPVGANLFEGIGIFRYQRSRWMIETRVCVLQYGDNQENKNYGGDIFVSYLNRPYDYGNYTGQGLLTRRNNLNFRVSYYIWPKASLSLDAGIIMRKAHNANGNYVFNGVFIGVSSKLVNSYRDF